MFLCSAYFIIAKCSSDQTDQKLSTCNDDDHYDCNLDHIYRILEDEEISCDFYDINNSSTETESTTVNNNACSPNSEILQENSNKDSFSSKNFTDDNSMIQSADDENINLKTHSQFNKDSSIFTTPKPQNDGILCPQVSAIEIENIVDCSTENEHEISDILNQAFKTVFAESEIDKRLLQSEEGTNEVISKKRRTSNIDAECSTEQNISRASNVIAESEILNCSVEVFEQESDVVNAEQSFVSNGELLKKIRIAFYNLKKYKPYTEEFFNSKIVDDSILIRINEINKYVRKLYNISFSRNKLVKEDSAENRNIFSGFLGLLSLTRKAHYFFETSIYQKIETLSTDKLTENIGILIKKIENIEELIEKLKILGIERLSGDKTSEEEILGNKMIKNTKPRHLEFLLQEKNNLNIQRFNLPIERIFFPELSFAISDDECIFLCICTYQQYLKILKINFNEKNCQNFCDYKIIGKDGNKSIHRLGYFRRHTMIRGGSNGKLIILKSSLKNQSDGASNANNFFEMISVDKNRKKISSIQVDEIKSLDDSYRPSIVDFVVYNENVYALDMKYKCVKIFNESLELIKIIPIPKILADTELIHLAVSNKFILLGVGCLIYYININSQYAVFKNLKFDNIIHNIASYNEEYFIVKFDNGCYSFKMEEKLSDIKFTHLPSLDRLKNLSLTNFVVKDNFVYSFCAKTEQIHKLNITLNRQA